MPIYCDESGGISTGAMVFAGVWIDAGDADLLVERFKTVTGLRGEMKGSRISLSERGLFFELLDRFGGRAIICEAYRNKIPELRDDKDRDLHVYVRLLENVVSAWLEEIRDCTEVVIDEGRYDPKTLELVRGDIASLLGTCGRARLVDSKRSSGVQIADVIANCMFNLAIDSPRAARIHRITAPFMAQETLRLRSL